MTLCDEYFTKLFELMAQPSSQHDWMKAMEDPSILASAIPSDGQSEDLSSDGASLCDFDTTSDDDEHDHRSFMARQCFAPQSNLADAFYDYLKWTVRKFSWNWQEKVPLVVLVKEMDEFVPRSNDDWDEWNNEQRLEACITLALMFEHFNVMSLDVDQGKVCFQTSHKP